MTRHTDPFLLGGPIFMLSTHTVSRLVNGSRKKNSQPEDCSMGRHVWGRQVSVTTIRRYLHDNWLFREVPGKSFFYLHITSLNMWKFANALRTLIGIVHFGREKLTEVFFFLFFVLQQTWKKRPNMYKSTSCRLLSTVKDLSCCREGFFSLKFLKIFVVQGIALCNSREFLTESKIPLIRNWKMSLQNINPRHTSKISQKSILSDVYLSFQTSKMWTVTKGSCTLISLYSVQG